MSQASHEFKGSVDFNQNELRNATFQRLITPPISPVQGQLYYNTPIQVPFYWNTTKWLPFGLPPVHIKYADETALLADQVKQIEGYIYHDISSDIYYEKLETSTGDILVDYNPFGGSGLITASNGLNKVGNDIRLGDSYISYTPNNLFSVIFDDPLSNNYAASTVYMDSSSSYVGHETYSIDGTSGTVIEQYENSSNSGFKLSYQKFLEGAFRITAERNNTSGLFSAIIRDTINSKGLEYEGDYEANFTPRSLITQQYLTAEILANAYVHPTFTPFSINTSAAQVIDELTTTSEGHVSGITLRNLTLADLGYTGATDANNYVHPSYTPQNPTLTGALVLASLVTDSIGSVVSLTTRTLTTANIGAINIDQLGVANGVATLDSGGKLVSSQIPDSLLGGVVYIGQWDASTDTPTLPDPTTVKGNYYIVTVAGTQFEEDFNIGDWVISDGISWEKVDNTDAVMSVFGRIGNVVALATDYNGFYVRHDTAAQGLNGTQQSNARTNIQAELIIVGGATTITQANLTIDRALISNASGKVAVSAVTSTELGHVSGVTSPIQTQLNTKLEGNEIITLSGDVTGSGATSIVTTISNNAITTTKILDSNVTYAKIQNVSANRILGQTAVTGIVKELTAAEVRTIINVADGANNYAHPSKTWVDKTTLTGATVIANLTIDSLGHPTDWTTRNLTPSDISAEPAFTKGSLIQGDAMSVTGTLASRLVGTGDITIAHADTSTQASVDNSNGTIIQDVTLDTYGHITGLASLDGDARWARLINAIDTTSTWSHTSLQNGIDFTPYTTGSSGYPSTLGFAVAFYANTSDSTSGFGRAFALNRAYNTENYYLGSPNTSGVHNGWRLIYHSGNLTLGTLGGVPTTRTITINGVAQDLSADRTWSVGTVTSVAMSVPTGLSIAGTPITTSGTLDLTYAAGYAIPTTAKQTEWDTAYSNRITSLTTTGSSGAATLISNVLNIPNYTLAGLGGIGGTIASGQVAFGTDANTIGGSNQLKYTQDSRILEFGATSTIKTNTGNLFFDIASSGIIQATFGGAIIADFTLNSRSDRSSPLTFYLRSQDSGQPSRIWSFQDFSINTGSGSGGIRRIVIPSTGNVGIGDITPTNTLDVNGTARIRTLANATGNFVTTSTTGVLQQRTAAEVKTDLGLATAITGTGVAGQVAFWTGAGTQSGDSGLVWDNAGKRLGILTATPIAPFTLGDRGVNNSSRSQILISRTINSSSGNDHAFADSSLYSPTVNNLAYNSYDARINIGGSSNINHYTAFQDGTVSSNTGTMSNYWGFISSVSINSGIITNYQHFEARNVVGLGNITNQFGLRIRELNKASNNWAIYTDGNTRSYFGGRVGIGEAGTNPDKLLEIRTNTGTESGLRIRQSGQNFWDIFSPASSTSLGIGDVGGLRWSFLAGGILQSNGAQTIQTSTGNLTLATAAGNGNIILNPNGAKRTQIETGTTISFDLSTQITNSIAFSNATTGSGIPTMTGKSDTHIGLFLMATTNNTNTNQDFVFNIRENDNSDFSTLTSVGFRFSRFTTPLIDIIRNGNVLIGTTTDSGDKLRVNGTVRIDSVTNAVGNVMTISATGVLQQRTIAEIATDGGFVTLTGAQTITGAKTFNADTVFGDVALDYVGWDNTSKTFGIFSQTQYIHKYRGGAAGALNMGQYDVSGNASINNTSNAKLLFGTNNTSRLEIEADGDIIIPSVPSGTGDTLMIEAGGRVVKGSSGGTLSTGTSLTLVDSTGGATYTLSDGNYKLLETSNYFKLSFSLGISSSSGTPSGKLRITGLPTMTGATSGFQQGNIMTWIDGNVYTNKPELRPIWNQSSNYIEFLRIQLNVTENALLIGGGSIKGYIYLYK